MLRWLGRNLSTLVLAFTLAVVVWVSAVLSTDPNVEAVLLRPVELEVVGLDSGSMQVAKIPATVRLTLNAPQSIWDQLNLDQNSIRAWIDLSGLGEGTHPVEVRIQIGLTPVQIVKIEPPSAEVTIEPRLTRTLAIHANITGDPALGYRKGTVRLDPETVTFSGPRSLTNQVVAALVEMDVSGANDTVKKSVTVLAVDQKGEPVTGLNITPPTAQLEQLISLLGGYRNVVVKVVTTGQVADGYWLTNLSVSPPNVTVFSSDPTQVNALPGFVETTPIGLTDLRDDVDVRATLNLPEGVTLAGEASVLVRLSIAALEGSLPVSLPIEVVGLPPELHAILSPDSVEVLLTGPLTILNNLAPGAIRISVKLVGFELGEYQVTPVVDLIPPQVEVASIIPASVQVTIQVVPTSSEPVSPATVTPSTTTPTPTP